jgi:propionate CoA-transferase
MAQCDTFGNVNVSKFNGKLVGCGGFINISQNTKIVIFLGTFTNGDLQTKIHDGKLIIIKEGNIKKFVKNVEQITFSGEYSIKNNQIVFWITERCVFRLSKLGLVLIEIAPGIFHCFVIWWILRKFYRDQC